MGTGYTRQSAADIVTGAVIEALPLNREFNQLQSAFNGITGHSHDGTTGEGPKISLTTSLVGILPIAHGGYAGIHKTDATAAPGVSNDSSENYAIGSTWIDVTNDIIYIATDVTPGAAVWQRIGVYDAELAALAGLTSAADKLPYFTGPGTAALADFTPYARTLVDDADATTARATLGLVIGTNVQAWSVRLDNLVAINDSTGVICKGGTGNTFVARIMQGTTGEITIMNPGGAGGDPTFSLPSALNFTDKTINGTNLTISGGPTIGAANLVNGPTLQNPVMTGGSWSGGTDLAVADGGTGASTAANARSNLGLAIGTDVQAWSTHLATLHGLAKTSGNLVGTNGTTYVSRSAAQARSDLNLGSLATQSTINNSDWSGTVLAISNGGTGANNDATARNNLGLPLVGEAVARAGALGANAQNTYTWTPERIFQLVESNAIRRVTGSVVGATSGSPAQLDKTDVSNTNNLVTISLYNISSNTASDNVRIQVISPFAPITSGYVSQSLDFDGTTQTETTDTSGIPIRLPTAAGAINVVITLNRVGAATWAWTMSGAGTGPVRSIVGGGRFDIGGTNYMSAIRIFPVTGTFDAGQFAISYG